MTIEAIREFMAADMRAVDEVIRRRLESGVPLIRQVAQYIVGGGGKRLRPMLLLLSAGAFGYGGPHRHELAAVVEFIHTATLLHDDVVDESELRRGRATANALFGNSAAVLVGDFVYSRPVVVLVNRWTGSMGEGLAIGFDATGAGAVVAPRAHRLFSHRRRHSNSGRTSRSRAHREIVLRTHPRLCALSEPHSSDRGRR